MGINDKLTKDSNLVAYIFYFNKKISFINYY